MVFSHKSVFLWYDARLCTTRPSAVHSVILAFRWLPAKGRTPPGFGPLTPKTRSGQFFSAIAGVLAGAFLCVSCSGGQACDAVARFPVLVVRMTGAVPTPPEELKACINSVCTPLSKHLPSDLPADDSAWFAVFNELSSGVKVKITVLGSGATPVEKSTSVIPKADKLGGCKGRVVADVTIDASTGEFAPSQKRG